jgi:site-specific DNA-methyltransferase (adenine-specific)
MNIETTNAPNTTETAIGFIPCYAQPFDTVIHSNFLNNTLPDKCANLIIADFPYFEVKGDFDFIWNSFDEFLSWVELCAKEFKRLLKDNGTLFVYGHAKKIAYKQVIFDKYFNLENSLVWKKKECQTMKCNPKEMRSFAPITERILMYSNEFRFKDTLLDFFIGDKWLLEYMQKNVLLIGLNTAKKYNNFLNAVNKYQHHLTESHFRIISEDDYNKLRTFAINEKINAFSLNYNELIVKHEQFQRPFIQDRLQVDVLEYSQESNITKNYDHETKKPETLTRALILTCSRKNDLVVVPFAGSGTEVAMSIKEGRKAIGYDIEKKYVDMSNKRIKTFKDAPSLF